jgi:Bacterial protein of unknown function (DUF885)
MKVARPCYPASGLCSKVLVLLVLAFSLVSPLPAQQKSAAGWDAFTTLAADFWTWRAQYQPFSADDIPRIERPGGERDWSAASIARQRADLDRFEKQWKGMDVSGWSISQQVDYRLIGSAIARVHWELDITRRWERDPGFYVEQTVTPLLEALTPPPPFTARRSAEILVRMKNIPSILSEGKRNLRPLRPFAQLAITALDPIRAELEQVQDEVGPMLQSEDGRKGTETEEFKKATEAAIPALEDYREWLRQRLASMPEQTAIGRGNYQFFLTHVALLPYTPEQLLAISRQEWDRTVAFEQYEKHRDAPLPELKPAANLEEQIKNSTHDELAIRKFLEARHILTVPAAVQHYTVRALPGYLKALGDFGELDDFTGPSRLKQDGTRWTPPPSPQLGYFAKSATLDPRPLIVHEGVPGHYFQMAESWMHEDPIRRHFYDSSANEGIGFYAEEMMMQAGLFDDSPRTREIIYSFMRLRALRVEVDVKLALGLFTMAQAAEYLEQHVPMDKTTAGQEAAFFATGPGQAISYQIGKAQILRFLADAKLAQADKFSLQAFHDFLWKNGNVPIALQRWEYLGKDDDIRILDGR